jgi:hypothetical protein
MKHPISVSIKPAAAHGGFFALPAGWRFYWVVQKAECYLNLD